MLAAPCANPYFPDAPGTAWAYRIGGAAPERYRVKILAANARGFIEKRTGGVPLTLHWTCTPSGWTLPSADVVGTLPTMQSAFTMHAGAVVGTILPAAPMWHLGAAWTYAFPFRSTTATANVTQTLVGHVTVSNAFIRTAHETVPAGSYVALEVRSRIVVAGTESLMGHTVPIHAAQTVITDYVRGVGMIRTTSGIETTSLTSIVPPR